MGKKAKAKSIAPQADPACNVPEVAAEPGTGGSHCPADAQPIAGSASPGNRPADGFHGVTEDAPGVAPASAGLISRGIEAVRSTFPPQGPERAASGGITQGQSVGVPLAKSPSLRTDAAVDPLGTAIEQRGITAGGEPAFTRPGRHANREVNEGKDTAEAEVPSGTSADNAVRSTPQIHVPVGPMSILLPYQAAWALDSSRWKIGLQARQTGKDFASGAEGLSLIHI